MLADSLNTLICTPNAIHLHRFQWILSPKGHFHTSETQAFDALTYPEFAKYFTIANNRLYTLLEDDEELHCLVHAIELINQSNHCLEEIWIRQEQFAYSQFKLALNKGLQ